MATPAAQPSAHATQHKRRVNELICESMLDHPETEEIAFFCECAREQCFDVVWIERRTYQSARETESWLVLAPGH